MIRTLIVDDEPLARQGIRLRLELEADMAIVGEADDGPSAVEAIRSLRPDLVFLDVQMPGFSGFEVLEQASADHLPMVVFVTAHDSHALKAFEVHALDYLLKPYTESRFQEALNRARGELARPDESVRHERLAALLDALSRPSTDSLSDPRTDALSGPSTNAPAAGPGWLRRFTVRDRDRILLVRADEVEVLEAAGNYVQLTSRGATHLVRQTLAELEARLDPAMFIRIHRSTIVNLEQVREIRPDTHGDADVLLRSGAVHRLSRAYRSRLLPGG